MQSRLNPYLHFKNTARQAMEFYKTVFGGKLTLSTFGESHATEDPAFKDLIMHAQLETDESIVLMASDTPPEMTPNPGHSVNLSISGDDEALLKGYWEKLSQGATIIMPLEKAPWGDTFGMLTDQFGMEWMVNITGAKS